MNPPWSTIKTAIALVAEKVGWTFFYQFIVVLVAGASGALFATQHWATAADAAGFTAVLTLITAVIQVLGGWTYSPLVDAVVRVVLTFLQSFGGTLIAAQVTSVVHANWEGALATAFAAALPSAIKVFSVVNQDTLGASVIPLRVAAPRYVPEHQAA